MKFLFESIQDFDQVIMMIYSEHSPSFPYSILPSLGFQLSPLQLLLSACCISQSFPSQSFLLLQLLSAPFHCSIISLGRSVKLLTCSLASSLLSAVSSFFSASGIFGIDFHKIVRRQNMNTIRNILTGINIFNIIILKCFIF